MRKVLAFIGVACLSSTALAVDVGPDAFGYYGTDIDHVWNDISATGTEITLGDDDHMFLAGAMSFGFPFYGNTYNDLAIESNGTFVFTDTYISLSNYQMPYSGQDRPLIATFWDDLDPGNPAVSHIYYQDMGDRFVVQFTDVPHYPDGDMELNTFQTIFHASGDLEMQYSELTQDAGDGGWGATIGIQGDGYTGLTWAYNDAGPNFPSRTGVLWYIPEPTSLSLLALGGLALLRRR